MHTNSSYRFPRSMQILSAHKNIFYKLNKIIVDAEIGFVKNGWIVFFFKFRPFSTVLREPPINLSKIKYITSRKRQIHYLLFSGSKIKINVKIVKYYYLIIVSSKKRSLKHIYSHRIVITPST